MHAKEDSGKIEPDAPLREDAAGAEAVDETAALIDQLIEERDQAVAARQRALADFANYQRRSIENERRARQDGSLKVLRGLVEVVDHFERALNQEPATLTVEQLLAGMKLVRDEFLKSLESHGVTRIEPTRGEAFDPNRHEAMLRQPDDEIAPGHVVALFQTGYAAGEHVLRPAKVSVAPGTE